MKALSIRQPWAWAIVNAGKRVENRTWETRYRGPILIHAAKGVTKREYEQFASFWQNFPRRPLQSYPRPPSFDALQRGGIVARAEVIGCISISREIPLPSGRGCKRVPQRAWASVSPPRLRKPTTVAAVARCTV